MNPTIRKELRQRMRERRTWMLPSLYLVALGGAVALAYYLQTEDVFELGRHELQGAEIGVAVLAGCSSRLIDAKWQLLISGNSWAK